MVSENLNFTSITNNRPGYAVPITFIGLFILIPIISAFINKFKDLRSVDLNYTNKLWIYITILIIICLSIIALFVEFHNCIKYDIQMKIGERLIDLCGGSQYYQRESPDELIASMIYKKNTDPMKVEGSPLRANFIINILLNVIYLSIFIVYSIIIINRYILLLLDSDPSTTGRIPLLSFIKRITTTKAIEKRIISCIIFIFLVGYIVLYTLASISENTKIGKIPKDAGKKLVKLDLLKYSTLKVGIIGIVGLSLWALTKAGVGQSKVAGSEFMQQWNNSNILKILFGFILGLSILIFFYKKNYQQLPEVVRDYASKCESLNEILKNISTSQIPETSTYTIQANKLRNILYKNMIDLEPTIDDSLENLMNSRSDILYQFVKHNNGKELLQLENTLSIDQIESIRSKMKELRGYKNIKDTFKNYDRKVFVLFSLFVTIVFYIIFNYNYKNNKSQVVLLTVISIIILIIITIIFGWFSNAILMN